MQANYLGSLLRKYGGQSTSCDPLGDLLSKYREYRATNLLDCAVAATGLAIDALSNSPPDPLLLRAIHNTNPTFDSNAIYSDEELMGILNSAKGKYFEYLVADRLNDGEAVGDVLLPHGYKAELAESMTQPGWDLAIVGPDRRVAEYLQLKATDSIGYVHHALKRYPDIKILATSDVATGTDHAHMVLDSGITEEHLLAAVHSKVGNGWGILDHFWDAFHPVVPLLLMASMSGYSVLVGKRSVRDATEIAIARAHRALVASGTGALVKALGGGWLAIPAAMLAGYWVTRNQRIDQLIKACSAQSDKLALFAEYYNPRGANRPWGGSRV